jgi:hypothetical protein
VAVATLIFGVGPPLEAIGADPVTAVTPAAALMTPPTIVIVVPSGLTTPRAPTAAVATLIFGVAPPLEAIGADPVTAVTPPPPPPVVFTSIAVSSAAIALNISSTPPNGAKFEYSPKRLAPAVWPAAVVPRAPRVTPVNAPATAAVGQKIISLSITM